MSQIVFVALFACLAIANAGTILAGSSAKIIQGPSTRTTVVGPDGSSISSSSPGGSIIQEDIPGVVAETAPVIAAAPAVAYSAPIAYSAPATQIAYSAAAAPIAYSAAAAPLAYTAAAAPLAYSAGAPYVAAYSAPLAYQAPLAYSAGPLAYSAGLVAEKQLDTVVAGPSGTIATSKTVNRPALLASPQVYAAGVPAYYL
ncbi:cuticle protein 16.5 [Dendroctonus ponderosae]|uniref:cuticle protein 16.5 n=1 Tax=Dendroctonus ponderosae TaxID=77166 RepID=UPI002034AB45|nr:cuticle protein 16.5 [Dendroctonus ponderosae]